jgi:hypothetical protein
MEMVKHQQVSDEEVIILPREMYEKFMREREKKAEVKKGKGASFTISFASYILTYGKDAIASASKVELLDVNLNVVKTFTSFYTLDVVGEADKQYIRVRIVDNSTDAYSFKYMYVYYVTGGTLVIAIKHTFSQTYTKGSDQIADITVRTGISGLV